MTSDPQPRAVPPPIPDDVLQLATMDDRDDETRAIALRLLHVEAELARATATLATYADTTAKHDPSTVARAALAGIELGRAAAQADPPTPAPVTDDGSVQCGAWGGCTLPAGHNMGKPDLPHYHQFAPPAPPSKLAAGGDHSNAMRDLAVRVRVAWKDHRSVNPELANQLAELVSAAPTDCRTCGKQVEPDRLCYAVPTCHACLPPPPPLPVFELKAGKPAAGGDLIEAAEAVLDQLRELTSGGEHLECVSRLRAAIAAARAEKVAPVGEREADELRRVNYLVMTAVSRLGLNDNIRAGAYAVAKTLVEEIGRLLADLKPKGVQLASSTPSQAELDGTLRAMNASPAPPPADREAEIALAQRVLSAFDLYQSVNPALAKQLAEAVMVPRPKNAPPPPAAPVTDAEILAAVDALLAAHDEHSDYQSSPSKMLAIHEAAQHEEQARAALLDLIARRAPGAKDAKLRAELERWRDALALGADETSYWAEKIVRRILRGEPWGNGGGK